MANPATSVRELSPASPPLSLYIHLPWCVRKCPYCDFNSHAAREALPEARYVQALLADLEQDLPKVWGRAVSSVFIGGGTPSLFSAAAIDDLLAGVRARLTLAPEAEITLEANPGTVEHDRFEDYRAAGVNRISLGVQSFNDTHLQRLGRIHGADQARAAIELVAAAGFDNFNLDLMFALPEQTVDQAVADIESALDFNPPHLSHYQLTLEPNTAFAAAPPPLPDADTAWAMQQACGRRLQAAGLRNYEISAWARPGHACRHNLNYWRFGDYLGIGAGAHGKLTFLTPPPSSHRGSPPLRLRRGARGDASAASSSIGEIASALYIQRTAKHRHPKHYLAAAEDGDFIAEVRELTPPDRIFEYFLNRFRLSEAVSLAEFEARTGLAREHIRAYLDKAQSLELIEIDGGRVSRTARGARYLDDLVALFLP